MGASVTELREATARNVSVSNDALLVDLADGRTITVPLPWFPRLAHGTAAERANWRLIGGGEGIHWPELDEDISVESLLAGRKSDETQESLRRWLSKRKTAGRGGNSTRNEQAATQFKVARSRRRRSVYRHRLKAGTRSRLFLGE